MAARRDEPLSDADRELEGTLKRLQENNEHYIKDPSTGNDVNLVSAMSSHAGALKRTGQPQRAREMEEKKSAFTTASKGKKRKMALALSKKLVRFSLLLLVPDVKRCDSRSVHPGPQVL